MLKNSSNTIHYIYTDEEKKYVGNEIEKYYFK